MPAVAGAEKVNDDELCANCHEAYVKSFATNVHGMQKNVSCEACHGPASKHLETRGKEPGLILSFKTDEFRARSRKRACSATSRTPAPWEPAGGLRYMPTRASPAPIATGRTTTFLRERPPRQTPDATASRGNDPAGSAVVRGQDPGYSEADQRRADGRRRIGLRCSVATTSAPWRRESATSAMATCRTAGDRRPAPDLRPQRLQLHHVPRSARQDPGDHAEGSVPGVPHGEHRRRWPGTPRPTTSTAWPAPIATIRIPRTCVPQVVNISHYRRRAAQAAARCRSRSRKRATSAIRRSTGSTRCLSHHPIKEGKMVCSDCHDAHGQPKATSRPRRVNLLCYKCHAEKQGPFAYEHPPVTENCAICHEPHGTVANNLLRQPTTFLCLRCHTGHRTAPRLHGTSTHNPDIAGTRSTPIARAATRRSTAAICRRRCESRISCGNARGLGGTET